MTSKSYKNLPDTPGVYLFKDRKGKLLYIGKAGNLKRRVSSYFLRPHDSRIQKLVNEIKGIEYRKTDTAIEALILETELIKKYQPPYNIREKDDSSFLYVGITRENFPRVLLVRGNDIEGKRPAPSLNEHSKNRSERKLAERSARFSAGYGPFTSSSQAREALKIIRRIFPFSTHETDRPLKQPCFDYQIGLCPGTCIGLVNKTDYMKNIRNLELFFEGGKRKIIKNLRKEMGTASRAMEYEKAEKLKRQLFALQHIQDVALIKEGQGPASPLIRQSPGRAKRIEGYDISNISGTSAVGSMVVFTNGEPDKSEYRKFKIKTIFKSDDIGMIKEIITRRLRNSWPKPDLILIDGGRGQVNAAKEVLSKLEIRIPIVGLAKGPKRKRNDLVGKIPAFTNLKTLIRVRDEAHRFAISYHKKVRGREFIAQPFLRARP